jgi:hypothetical protein
LTDIRALEQEEYQELLAQEGDTLPIYVLAALHFEPPRPMTDKEADERATLEEQGVELVPNGMQNEYLYGTVVLLNVNDACYHKEYDGSVVFVLPADRDKITYEMLSTIHSEHGAWCYRIEPRYWNPYDTEKDGDPMSDAWWWFKPINIPDFDLSKENTH